MDTYRRPSELGNVGEIHESMGHVDQRLEGEKPDNEIEGGTCSTMFLALRL